MNDKALWAIVEALTETNLVLAEVVERLDAIYRVCPGPQ